MSDKQRVVIFSSILSNRLNYVLETIFEQRLKVSYILTDNTQLINSNDVVIEYNKVSTTDYDFIEADDFIQQRELTDGFRPGISGEEEELLLFPTESSVFSMDIFSAVFYCLSHYDAYIQKEFDAHHRVKFDKWFPRKSGLDRLPYVEIWQDKIKNYLEIRGLSCHVPAFEQDISFDIDHIYLMDQRPFFQHIKASIGDILKLNFFQLFHRWLIILGITEDPAEKFFDLLDYNFKNRFNFFILMKHGKNNSLNPLNELKKLLIKKLKKHGEIGIHPSYEASYKTDLIQKETNQLTEIVEYKITESRFHFLRINFPSSFHQLISAGIKTDKSIGYYDQPGFLSSTCLPYQFFDPVKNEVTSLFIEPFVWMDSMNKYYRDLDEKEEKSELMNYKSIVRKYNGKFNVVFHNDSMIDRRYRKLLKSLLYN